jgi:mono/diheme cytochrome c family protein
MPRRSWLIAVLIFFLASGSAVAFWFITDMYDQISIKPQEDPRPLPEGIVPVQGFPVPRGYQWNTLGDAITNPVVASESVIQRGQVLYERYCVPCHGVKGDGDGPVALRGFRPWWPLSSPQTQLRSDGYIFAHIWLGGPLMPPYRYGLSVTDTWSLVHYVRSLTHATQ